MKRVNFILAAACVATVLPEVGNTEGTPKQESTKIIAEKSIPNVPGKRLVSLIVDYAPGARSVPHDHADSAFVYAYVLSGSVRSQVDDGPVHVYTPGEWWFENPGAHHRVSENASSTEPARLLATFIVDDSDKQLTFPRAK